MKEIFIEAEKLKMSAVAVTDHDTVLGIDEEYRLSIDYNIPFIPAVEFTALEEGLKFHVLGYNIDYNSKELKDYSTNLMDYLNERSLKQIRMLRNSGIDIPEEEFFKESKGGPLYRAKLLRTLVRFGYLKDEDVMFSLNDYFGEGKVCYLKDEYKYNNFEETCSLIKRNGGIVVLAHPAKIKKKNEKLYERLIQSSLIDGIELYHPSNADIINELLSIVKQRNLIYTGGSDYHGKNNKKLTPICGIEIPDDVYYSMKPYMKNK